MVRNRGALSAGATQQLRPFAGISWGRVFNSRCSAVLYCIRSVVNTPRMYLTRTRNSAREAVLDSPVAALKVYSKQKKPLQHIRRRYKLEPINLSSPAPKAMQGP